jgi:hypothetical protein
MIALGDSVTVILMQNLNGICELTLTNHEAKLKAPVAKVFT